VIIHKFAVAAVLAPVTAAASFVPGLAGHSTSPAVTSSLSAAPEY